MDLAGFRLDLIAGDGRVVSIAARLSPGRDPKQELALAFDRLRLNLNPVQVSECSQVRLDDPFPGTAPSCPICGKGTYHRSSGWACISTLTRSE